MTNCRMAEYCRSYDPVQSNTAPATERGFCLPCECHGRYAISELRYDYVQLYTRIAAGGSGLSLTSVRVKQVDAPIPLRLNIDQLMRDIAWTLVVWELPVREHARLSPVAEKSVRPAVAVRRATTLLTAHYSVLLALGPTDYIDYAHGLSTADGPDAIVALTRLHHLSRAAIGLNRIAEPRQLPCPAEGCGQYALVEEIGSGGKGAPNAVHCTSCGWLTDADEYAKYARLQIPQGRRPYLYS